MLGVVCWVLWALNIGTRIYTDEHGYWKTWPAALELVVYCTLWVVSWINRPDEIRAKKISSRLNRRAIPKARI